MKNLVLATLCALFGACAGQVEDPNEALPESRDQLVGYLPTKPKTCTAQSQAVVWEETWYREQGVFIKCVLRPADGKPQIPGLPLSALWFYDCKDNASPRHLIAQLDFGDDPASKGLLEDDFSYNEYEEWQNPVVDLPVRRGRAWCGCQGGCFITVDLCQENPKSCAQ